MICYRDMTFCCFYKDCKKASECHRPLTPDIEKAAKMFGMPVAQFTNKPECHSDNKGAA